LSHPDALGYRLFGVENFPHQANVSFRYPSAVQAVSPQGGDDWTAKNLDRAPGHAVWLGCTRSIDMSDGVELMAATDTQSAAARNKREFSGLYGVLYTRRARK
jgi:hypothetical protein